MQVCGCVCVCVWCVCVWESWSSQSNCFHHTRVSCSQFKSWSCDPGPIPYNEKVFLSCSDKDKTSTNTFVLHIFCGLWLIWIIVLSYYVSVIFGYFYITFSHENLPKGFSFSTEMPKKNCFWFPKEPFSDQFFGKNYLFIFCEEHCNYLKNLFHFEGAFVEWKDFMDVNGSSLNHQ